MKHLLLLEKESTYSKFLKFQCQGSGYKLHIARGLDDAKTLFKEVESLAAILLDYEMMGAESVDLVKRLRKAQRKEPIILVSELDNLQMLVDMSRYGLAAVLEKPIDFEELQTVLQRLEKAQPASAQESTTESSPRSPAEPSGPEDLVRPFLPFNYFAGGSLFSIRWMSYLVRRSGESRKIVIGQGGEVENLAREYARIRYGRKYAPKFFPLGQEIPPDVLDGAIEESIFPVFTLHLDGGDLMPSQLQTLLQIKRSQAGDFILYIEAPGGVLPNGLDESSRHIIREHGLLLPPLACRPADFQVYLHRLSQRLVEGTDIDFESLWTPARRWGFWLAFRSLSFQKLAQEVKSFFQNNETGLKEDPSQVPWPGQDALASEPIPEMDWNTFLLREARAYELHLLENFEGDLSLWSRALDQPAYALVKILQGEEIPLIPEMKAFSR